ncbi:MAG: rod shape-determining protein MreC [Chromatiales bacterium]|jgi:rod shape-determining protein MreC|nr:rod shape-determining protein MreC [Chromatiales bacterium]
MVLDHRGSYLEEARRQLAAAFYPVQQAINAPFRASRWLSDSLASRDALLAENADLRRKSLVNDATLQRYAALQAENARLRALLDSTARVPDKVVIGEVLSVEMDRLHHRIIVNKGQRSGTRDGQALIDAQGVVGQVTRTAPDSAEALLITDPDHALPVEVVRNGLRTIAVGTGNRNRLSLPYLTRNQDVEPGDLLVTSGLGGAFPAGYPVGTVTKVDDSRGDAFRDITARPAARLDRLHEVLLVLPGTSRVAADAELAPPPGLAAAPVRGAAPPPASPASEPAPAPAAPAATPARAPVVLTPLPRRPPADAGAASEGTTAPAPPVESAPALPSPATPAAPSAPGAPGGDGATAEGAPAGGEDSAPQPGTSPAEPAPATDDPGPQDASTGQEPAG